MKLFLKMLLLAAVSNLAHASNDWREIRVDEDGSRSTTDKEIQIRGTWMPAGQYERPRVPRINSVQFNCYKDSMTCLESQAQVIQLRGDQANASPRIVSYTITYKVQEWTDRQVLAVRVNPKGGRIDQKVTIGLREPTVKMEWKESALDAGDFAPGAQAYELPIKYPY